ncbi:MAG: tRNA (N(6)-L-threonylcarbamoyladenosine(37)-C(2))-methylthiotransferase MtaB [Lachnospiraceae bacterium]|uniref:tRNA (N(6)-L-threonylcarbamoyladenosine(37)-C(2))- methylthiotransferase MtaB n=1 Tax=uncultured Acetatifactor sp. TaxID=1671927 RepID=UPI002636D39D|nr:tRNA (N(6)-L-threonylcarbamoyladenosine(37)-C(2))-methylthiotransferase MtaB [uncultured Acetatifactor sp.]MCI8788698.1 tRNA (N(6)-L-threonylcarbamoyladenosine(37)-C(2))-methylthiotransferase MtaB [Lachnospiraceae bacterium]
MENVALYNLGCKVNSYEMEVMRQMFREKGYRIVSFDEKADIYIVNTCTVTNIADRKSRQMLHRARQLNPNAVVVAVGCYVQTGREAVEKDPAVDLAVGNNRKKDIVAILEAYLRERKDKTLGGATILDIARTYEYEEMQLKGTAEHTRAYIKIQDGCNQFCSYCAIPYARGRVRSRRQEDILREIRGLAEAGYREAVLTGIHISSYGIDFNGSSRLVELVEGIGEIPGLDRIRLGSLEPRIVTPETAKRLAAIPQLCPHFHLSLQSGCDATLKRMNRRYTTGEYYKSVEALREAFHEPAITTDVIVGFPGETEEEFARTKEFLEKVRFYEMHVFKYSRRAGTAAASMPDQVPEPMKAQRSGQLLDMEKQQSEAFRRRYIGRTVEVLLEEERRMEGRTYCIGHTKDYVKVAVDTTERTEKDGIAVNGLAEVRVRGFLTDEILM